MLGSMPFDATPETHIAAGEWCFLDCADRFPHWMDQFTIIDSRPTYQEDEQYTAALMGWGSQQLHKYAEKCNSSLREPLSPYIWELLLGRWCITIIPFIGLAYRVAQQAVTRYEHTNLVVPISKPTAHTHKTLQNLFQDLITSSGFYLLLSAVIEKVAPPAWTLVPQQVSQKSTPPQETLFSLTASWFYRKIFRRHKEGFGLRGLLREATQRIIDRSPDLPIPQFPFSSCWQRLFLSAVLFTNRQQTPRLHPLLRERYPSNGQKFPQWMAQLLWEYLPDDFKAIETQIKCRKSLFKLWICDIRFSTQQKYLIKYASLAAGGVRLYTVQHAPTYFAIPTIGIASAEEYNHAGFLMWGDGGEKFQTNFPAPAPPLVYNKLYGAHKEKNESIYYILDKQRPIDIPNCFSLFRPVRENMKNLKEFYTTLPQKLKTKFCIRHYDNATGSFDSRSWEICKKIPAVAGDNIQNMSQARIIVVNYLASSFGQALILNAPCLWIWQFPSYKYTKKISYIFNLFRSVGIIHDTPMAAATFLANQWDNIPNWWQSSLVQDVRVSFVKNYYGLYSKYPLYDWMRLIHKL